MKIISKGVGEYHWRADPVNDLHKALSTIPPTRIFLCVHIIWFFMSLPAFQPVARQWLEQTKWQYLGHGW